MQLQDFQRVQELSPSSSCDDRDTAEQPLTLRSQVSHVAPCNSLQAASTEGCQVCWKITDYMQSHETPAFSNPVSYEVSYETRRVSSSLTVGATQGLQNKPPRLATSWT